MSLFSASSQNRTRRAPAHLVPVALGGGSALLAVALVAYLLWPTFTAHGAAIPDRLPVSVGATLFNVPTSAIRVKIQRHSGPQERIDLAFDWPSLAPPEAPRHVSAETIDDRALQRIDRIFVSIAAHHDALGPDERARTIYPRYLDIAASSDQGGLTMRAFRAGTPYVSEDLFSADAPALVARCTRDGVTPGMCLSERRIDGADLTFRFPRGWLAQWRDVAGAMERLTAEMRGPRS